MRTHARGAVIGEVLSCRRVVVGDRVLDTATIVRLNAGTRCTVIRVLNGLWRVRARGRGRRMHALVRESVSRGRGVVVVALDCFEQGL